MYTGKKHFQKQPNIVPFSLMTYLDNHLKIWSVTWWWIDVFFGAGFDSGVFAYVQTRLK